MAPKCRHTHSFLLLGIEAQPACGESYSFGTEAYRRGTIGSHEIPLMQSMVAQIRAGERAEFDNGDVP